MIARMRCSTSLARRAADDSGSTSRDSSAPPSIRSVRTKPSARSRRSSSRWVDGATIAPAVGKRSSARSSASRRPPGRSEASTSAGYAGPGPRQGGVSSGHTAAVSSGFWGTSLSQMAAVSVSASTSVPRRIAIRTGCTPPPSAQSTSVGGIRSSTPVSSPASSMPSGRTPVTWTDGSVTGPSSPSSAERRPPREPAAGWTSTTSWSWSSGSPPVCSTRARTTSSSGAAGPSVGGASCEGGAGGRRDPGPITPLKPDTVRVTSPGSCCAAASGTGIAQQGEDEREGECREVPPRTPPRGRR